MLIYLCRQLVGIILYYTLDIYIVYKINKDKNAEIVERPENTGFDFIIFLVTKEMFCFDICF